MDDLNLLYYWIEQGATRADVEALGELSDFCVEGRAFYLVPGKFAIPIENLPRFPGAGAMLADALRGLDAWTYSSCEGGRLVLRGYKKNVPLKSLKRQMLKTCL